MMNVKKLFLCALFCACLQNVFAQGVSIGEQEFDAHPAALLELRSKTKGLLIPKMNLLQRTAIAVDSSVSGLLVYQTDSIKGFYFFDGVDWRILSNPNAGYLPYINFRDSVGKYAPPIATANFADSVLKYTPELPFANFSDSVRKYGFDGDYRSLSNLPKRFDSNYFSLKNRPNFPDSVLKYVPPVATANFADSVLKYTPELPFVSFSDSILKYTPELPFVSFPDSVLKYVPPVATANFADSVLKYTPELPFENFSDSVQKYGFDGDYRSLSNLPKHFDSNYFSLKNRPNFPDSVLKYVPPVAAANFADSVLKYTPELPFANFSDSVQKYGFDGDYRSLSNLPKRFDSNYFSLKNRPNFPDSVLKYVPPVAAANFADSVLKYTPELPFVSIPNTEPADNARFLRNDNTWQNVTPGNIGAVDLLTYGSYLFFAPYSCGTGDGSSWENAKEFSIDNYDAMPTNTAALLLGDGSQKYVLSSRFMIVYGKPVYGGFVGNGLLREESSVTRSDITWSNVLFSRYATVFEGGNADESILVMNSYVDNIILGNCNIEIQGGCFQLSNSVANNCITVNCNDNYPGGCGGFYLQQSMLKNCSAINCLGIVAGGFFIGNHSSANDCEASRCEGSVAGGFMIGESSSAYNCEATHCEATGDGGGFYIDHSRASNCTASNCRGGRGGGFCVRYSEISHHRAVNCWLITATGGGGGFYLSYSTAVNCEATSCSAPSNKSHGGGFWVDMSSTVTRCFAANCSCNGIGGGFSLRDNSTADDCSVMGCYAPTFPGASPNYTGFSNYWGNTTKKTDL